MEAYVENWFDSEIAGKSQSSLVVETFVNEYNNFKRMMNAIDYCNESEVISISINEGKILEGIKKVWNAFVTWISGIFKSIKTYFDTIKTAYRAGKEMGKMFQSVDWSKVMDGFSEEEWNSMFEGMDQNLQESVVSEASGLAKSYIGIKIIAPETYFTSPDGLISDTEIGKEFIMGKDHAEEIIDKLSDIAAETDESKRKEILDKIQEMSHEEKQEYKDQKAQKISVIHVFGDTYKDYKSYSNYLIKHIDDIAKASEEYHKLNEHIKLTIKNLKSQYNQVEKNGEANQELAKGVMLAIKALRHKMVITRAVINGCKVDMSASIILMKKCLKIVKKGKDTESDTAA